MATILEKLIELIVSWFTYLIPWTILGDDECGLIRRFGVFKRLLKPGINYKWPLIETAMTATAAIETTVLREQSLTSADGVQVTVRGVITYRVVDPRKYILDCGTVTGVVNDSGCCVIAELLPQLNAAEILRGEAFTRDLSRKVRSRAKKWGIDVESFGLIDRTAARTYRLITNGNAPDSVPG